MDRQQPRQRLRPGLAEQHGSGGADDSNASSVQEQQQTGSSARPAQQRGSRQPGWPLLRLLLLALALAAAAALGGVLRAGPGGSAAVTAWWSRDTLFTPEQLAQYTGVSPGHEGVIYMAILGQVFDVSAKPEFYGAEGGYRCFAGRDGSKSFITGDFEGDVTDDVSSLDDEACAGLAGWLDFYHKTYRYKGKLTGRFYDQQGRPTPELAGMLQRAARGAELKAARARQEAAWPSCSSRWTQAEGGTVWCEGGLFPRKLFTGMHNGRPAWRCACFRELGWSDVRQVYPRCEPDASSCSTSPQLDAEEAALQAEVEAGLVRMMAQGEGGGSSGGDES